MLKYYEKENPRLIGLTGGIGSGKTIVANIFRTLGIAIYNADFEAKRIMMTYENVKEKILKQFGSQAYLGQQLNRKYIAQIVFNNTSQLKKLNSIVHPAIAHDFKNWATQQQGNYVIQEAAILFESGWDKIMDSTIFVDAPEELRVKRTTQRDGLRKTEVLNRIKNQWPAAKIKPLTDFIIVNDDKKLILPQLLEVHNKLNII